MKTQKKSSKAIINIVVGIAFIIGGIGFIISLSKNQTTEKRHSFVITLFFFLGTHFILRGVKALKNSTSIETDELSKRIGYTTLAASMQVLLLAICITLAIDVFLPFLHTVSAKEILGYILVISVAMIFAFQFWYKKRPDRTGL